MTPTRETRATVGLVAPRSRPRIPGPIRGCTAHWNGPAMNLAGRPHSECRARWRGIQNFHMKPVAQGGRNWADVAYTFAVCHHAVAMDGRGRDVRTAANGTNAGNDSWYACFFMLGGSEEPSREMLAAAEWYARVHLGVTNWNRHTDHKATTCAGTVNKYVSGGRLNIDRASGSGASASVKLGDRVLSLQDPMLRGDDVRDWQMTLNRWRTGIAGAVDGVFGPTTRDASAAFMREVMGVTTDNPQVGPKTIAAMQDRLSAPAPAPKPKEPTVAGYSDVNESNPHAENIAKAKELGLMLGYDDGTFRPGAPVTRQALATVMVRLYDKLSEQK